MNKIICLLVLITFQPAFSQEATNKKDSKYSFTVLKNLEATEVQNQNSTSTCWSFSSLSFFESELMRMGKSKTVNLSEMFVVRKTYDLKARNYIRMHGKTNFAEGGGFPDVLNVMRTYGIVPEDVYTGKKEPKTPHNHQLLEGTLKNILSTAAKDETQKIDFNFMVNSVNAVCDEYLGKVPDTFSSEGKTFTPVSYANSLGINPDDYVIITSFTHHPFYKKFVLEIPDNWNWESVYNVPLNELQSLMKEALEKGFSIAWGADVSEKGFLFKEGLALVPEKPIQDMGEEEKQNLSLMPQPQLTITQELRQKAFDNFETQDDHGMHITGMARDQNGTLYYIVKNSWGKERNQCGGYFYASESYVLYKTTSIMLHKKALSPALAVKLGIAQ
ncbi:MAG: aminopeptidase [Bacteroidia bacterium]|nr:aminopeptidase [Bacteroidia bacterium]